MELERMSQTKKLLTGTEGTIGNGEKPLSNVLVGIPAYNEEVAIGSTVLAALRLTDSVVVVDDGSSDNTASIAEEAGAIVIEHPSNRGKGAAIRTLFDWAGDESHDALVLIDGDGQHLPNEIPDVVDPVLEGSCDIAIGSRYIDGNGGETPLYRRFGQKTLDFLTSGSSGQSLTDTQSGFRALSPEAVEHLEITTDGLGVESEMISDATDRGMTMTEVPIDVKYEDVDGQTYNPVRHGVGVAAFVLQLVRDRHPMLFFGVPGLLLLGFGGLLGIDVILTYQSPKLVSPIKAALTGFVVIMGMLFLFCGLVLNQVANMISEVE